MQVYIRTISFLFAKIFRDVRDKIARYRRVNPKVFPETVTDGGEGDEGEKTSRKQERSRVVALSPECLPEEEVVCLIE